MVCRVLPDRINEVILSTLDGARLERFSSPTPLIS